MTDITTQPPPNKVRHGGWLPKDEQALSAFRAALAAHARAKGVQPLTPAVQALSDLIENTPILRMHLNQAIAQASALEQELEKATLNAPALHYSTIGELMRMINALMDYAPPFDTTELVGCPINALLDLPMCVPSGFAFFQFPEVNAKIRAVLEHWSTFLDSPRSRDVLTTDRPRGWFSAEASKYVDMALFQCDPAQPHWGYRSWNDFFIRRFRPGVRPVAGPGDPKVVVAACESRPFALQRGVRLQDDFWLKTQPYSLRDIFTAARADLAERYAGGTVYQAFLSAYDYHRWHAPVGGRVVEAYLVPGTYYSDVPSEGYDPAGPNNSQGYIAHVATRMVIVVDSGVPGLGMVACIFVGMAEISSCIATVQVGQTIGKGDELGYFQYGGSTHCLIFEPGVAIDFVLTPPYDDDTPVILTGSILATVTPKSPVADS
ncbi:MAG: phosphatidylserine decarboxylase family protein [Phaeospirillum sp.]|nr:phosphatidylserine decarboxylase family protein [Phaeospirillum sp.]